MADFNPSQKQLNNLITDNDLILWWSVAQSRMFAAQRSAVLGSGVALLAAAQSFAEAQTFEEVITADAGINFGQSTLSYHDQGNWSPTLTFGGASVGMTLQQVGWWHRIGDMVTAWGRLRVTAVGSSTGNARIGNLPFTSKNIISPNTLYYPVTFYVENISFSGFLEGAVTNNSTSFLLVQNVSGTITVLTHTAFSTNDSIYFSVQYPI